MLDWNDLLLTHPGPLSETCSESEYLERTGESRTRFWPIVEEGVYTGLMGPGGHILSVPALQAAQHPVDALAVASAWQVDCVAVCDKDLWQGSFKSQDIADRIGQHGPFSFRDRPFGLNIPFKRILVANGFAASKRKGFEWSPFPPI